MKEIDLKNFKENNKKIIQKSRNIIRKIILEKIKKINVNKNINFKNFK